MTPMPSLTRRSLLGSVLASAALAACSGRASGPPSGSRPWAAPRARSVFDPHTIHDWRIVFDAEDYTAMIETFLADADKDWLTGDLTLDERSFEDVGLRLKGNSSLSEITAASDPAGLPWLVTLDREHSGVTIERRSEFVIRSSENRTALNEAVALDLLAMTGLASQRSMYARLTVNAGDPRLRLVVEHPDRRWERDHFSGPGTLFKAEAGGDYSFRGHDAEAYSDVFEQVTGPDDPEAFRPLTDFLWFINNASERQFVDQLPRLLDVAAFARYLAFEHLVRNGDDIGGLGNNSYLRYSGNTRRMTVVAWDHNLAFVGTERGLQAPEEADDFDSPDGQHPGEAETRTAKPNLLLERFAAAPPYRRLYRMARKQLLREVFAGGRAERALDRRVGVLRSYGTGLLDQESLEREAQGVRYVLDSLRES